MAYVIGTDLGRTFTHAFTADEERRAGGIETPTIPPDFADGSPVRRYPAAVATDVLAHQVSILNVRDVHRVVLGSDGAAAEDARRYPPGPAAPQPGRTRPEGALA